MTAIQSAYETIRKKLISGQWPVGERLPPLTQLAKLCSVSRATMWKTLDRVKKESLLHVAASGAIVAGSGGESQSAPLPGGFVWERLKAQLGHDILFGAFTENKLPLVSKLALKYNVDIRTMQKSLAHLVQEGILTAQGRRYVLVRRRSTAHQPTIVLITAGDNDRGLVLYDPRTRSVVESFERECLRMGYKGRNECFNAGASNGFMDVCAVIKKIDPTVGFIVNFWNPWDETLWSRWLDLLNFIAARGVPVVVFDQAANLQFPDGLLRRSNFRSLRIAGVRAGEMAAEFMLGRGHRIVAYVTPYFGLDWVKDRYAGLCRAYKQYGGPGSKVELHSLDEIKAHPDLVLALLGLDKEELREFYRDRFSEDQIQGLIREWERVRKRNLIHEIPDKTLMATIAPIARVLAGLSGRKHDVAALTDMQVHLLHIADDRSLEVYVGRFLEAIIQKNTADAWVCSDDATAITAVSVLRNQGIRVPEQISVLGFNNWQSAYEHQLSTYDFNMQGMVLKALEIILDPKSFKNQPAISEVDGYVVERRTTRR